MLVVIVSTQALSVLGILVLPQVVNPPATGLFICLILYLIGCMFYLLTIQLIFYRLLFFNILT